MQVIIEEISNQIDKLLAAGIGRNLGKGQPEIQMHSFENILWAESRSEAEILQEADELGDFLLFLRPEMDFVDADLRRAFDTAMDEIAQKVKSVCDQRLLNFEIPGISKEPVGFRAPYAVQTVEFLIISLSQEMLAQKYYDLVDPLPCQDLLHVYEQGHILCGYDNDSLAVILY